MKRTVYAGLVAGSMLLAAGQAYAQSNSDSWAPAGAAAADPGSAPAQIHNASGTDSILSMSSAASADNSVSSGEGWAPAGAAAAD